VVDRVTAYLVPDWVRVRQEDFGLLFYDTRSTRLTFVRSGDRLAPPPFTGERRELRIAGAAAAGAARPAAAGASVEAALSRLLDGLVAKGLLVAAPEE
jgi:putative mycofactocin binding protein MftB